MKKTYLKKNEYNVWFYLKFMIYLQWMSYDGNGRKKPKYNKTKKRNQGKKFPVWLPSYTSVYEMEADCFPVSENTENKPDLP